MLRRSSAISASTLLKSCSANGGKSPGLPWKSRRAVARATRASVLCPAPLEGRGDRPQPARVESPVGCVEELLRLGPDALPERLGLLLGAERERAGAQLVHPEREPLQLGLGREPGGELGLAVQRATLDREHGVAFLGLRQRRELRRGAPRARGGGAPRRCRQGTGSG